MEKFEIVPMREESVPEILRQAEEGGLAPWSDADYRAEMNLDQTVALQIQEAGAGELAGFIVMRLITSIDNTQYSHSEILNITTDIKYRRMGLGSALIRKAIAISTNLQHSAIWLEVRYSNYSAIAFYEKHGFVCEYLRKSLYTNPPEDGWVMKLDIGEALTT